MPNLLKTMVAAALLAAAGLASASGVYAEQNAAPDTSDSRTGTGMRQGGMMGMRSGTTGQMSQMMESCNAMMQNRSQPPNSQFRKPPPSPKE